MTDLTLEQLDRDGALRETADEAGVVTRAGLIGGAAVAGLVATAAPAAAQSASSRGDVAILNFALVLEELEAAFYADALRRGALEGELALFARVVGGHEREHVRALRRVLGRRAVRRPRFDFRGTTEDAARFTATAIVLEETGVSAYKGQAPLIRSDAVLASALAIHSVEGRHVGWIRDLAGLNPAPLGLDPALTKGQVLARVARTRFIVRR